MAEEAPNAVKERNETIRFLIIQKMAYVSATVNVCMQWWVSSIVFCAAVLAAVWSNRNELRETPIFIGLGIVLFAFFGVISFFGFMVAHRLGIVQQEIAALADQLDYKEIEEKLEFRQAKIMKETKRFSKRRETAWNWFLGHILKTNEVERGGGFFYTEIITFRWSMRIGALSFALILLVWCCLWFYLLLRRA